MGWQVSLTDDVQTFLDGLSDEDRDQVLGTIELLRQYGPNLGRPSVDRIKQSRHHNMKELRVQCGDRQHRVLFAFDTRRAAILLVGGDKLVHPRGPDGFYDEFVALADDRLDAHLRKIEEEEAKLNLANKSAKNKKRKRK